MTSPIDKLNEIKAALQGGMTAFITHGVDSAFEYRPAAINKALTLIDELIQEQALKPHKESNNE